VATPYEGDLALADDGDLLIEEDDLALALGEESINSDVDADLKLWKGEWFLDLDEGVDYRGEVFVKNPDLPGVRDMLRARVLACAGVAKVEAISIDLDKTTRVAEVDFRARGDTGLLIADQIQVVQES
jgi:hypothetical protein